MSERIGSIQRWDETTKTPDTGVNLILHNLGKYLVRLSDVEMMELYEVAQGKVRRREDLCGYDFEIPSKPEDQLVAWIGAVEISQRRISNRKIYDLSMHLNVNVLDEADATNTVAKIITLNDKPDYFWRATSLESIPQAISRSRIEA